eukprot:516657-Pelagomonas_calceolata.AAC.1
MLLWAAPTFHLAFRAPTIHIAAHPLSPSPAPTGFMPPRNFPLGTPAQQLSEKTAHGPARQSCQITTMTKITTMVNCLLQQHRSLPHQTAAWVAMRGHCGSAGAPQPAANAGPSP